MNETSTRPKRGSARTALLEAAVKVIRHKGLHATSVDDLCTEAGVTKGAFFHHFASKQALAVAAAEHWSQTTGALFREAAYHDAPTAAGRVLGYLDLRAALAGEGGVPDVTCLAGTMTQEAYEADAQVRDACAESIFGHAAELEADMTEALEDAGLPPGVDARGLARHTQAVLQGAFILAKASGDTGEIVEAVTHLRRYLETILLATPPTTTDGVRNHDRNR